MSMSAFSSPLFAPAVAAYWQTCFAGDVLYRDTDFTVVTRPDLDVDSPVMVLKTADGRVSAALTPDLADRARLGGRANLSEAEFRRALTAAGITLNGADYVFYFGSGTRESLTDDCPDVRRLTDLDSAIFAEFESGASAADLDGAYVELDHWAVFGAFEQPRLVCAASAYPWDDAPLADLGVLTLSPFRGNGHARTVVRALSRYVYEQGYEPQYRCQLDNYASVALAKSLGLQPFGEWEVIAEDGPAGIEPTQG